MLDLALCKRYSMDEYRETKQQLQSIRDQYREYVKQFEQDFREETNAMHNSNHCRAQPPYDGPANDEYFDLEGLDIKRIYKDLCRVYHPDVPDTGDEDLFISAQDAYEESDVATLIDMACKCPEIDVDLDGLDQHFWQSMQYEIDEMNQEIYETQHRLPWLWCTVSEQEKPEMRARILAHFSAP